MTSVGIRPQTGRHAPNRFLAIDSHARTFLLGLLLVVATVAVYYPAHHHPFFYPDDGVYVVNNPHIQKSLDWQTVQWAFQGRRSYWHPVTWLSHALDYQFFGLNPAGHHDMNLVFHVLNALVLFWVLRRVTGYTGRSIMVAALFALHPINVEPVVWIAERKTLICTLFCLLTLAAYSWYARAPKDVSYAAVLILFFIALMGKPLAVILPFVLLLWDYWPLGRMFAMAPQSSAGIASATVYRGRSFFRLVMEKVPLLLVSALDTLGTMKNQGVLHPPETWSHPLSIRVGNAIVAYVRYIGKAAWPFGLAPFYPHPGTSLRVWQVLGALAVLLAITALVAANWRRRYLTVGWLWFLVVLVPNIGLVQLGQQALADRYAYLSFLGLFIMICWGAAEWAEQRRLTAAWLPAVSVAVLLALGVIAHHQVRYWTDELTLWSHESQVVGGNYLAEYRIGYALLTLGKTSEAMPHFYRGLAMNPSDPWLNMQIAFYEHQRGNLPAAIEYYKTAVRSQDRDFEDRPQALANLGFAYRELGDSAKADEYLSQSVAAKQKQAERDAMR